MRVTSIQEGNPITYYTLKYMYTHVTITHLYNDVMFVPTLYTVYIIMCVMYCTCCRCLVVQDSQRFLLPQFSNH